MKFYQLGFRYLQRKKGKTILLLIVLILVKQYIFDRFYSGDKSHTNKSNFGLGLSIAKELTQMLNGIIIINDTAGGGATFTVKFPLK